MKVIENFIKGPVMTLFGLALMVLAAYGWWVDYLTDAEASGLGVIGFALCFLKTKLDDLVTEWLKKFIEKFTK